MGLHRIFPLGSVVCSLEGGKIITVSCHHATYRHASQCSMEGECVEETNVQFLGKRNCWKGIEKSNVPLITLSFNPEAGVVNVVLDFYDFQICG